jgi:hypothetical protein
MVERVNPVLPISQQCRLLAVPRSSLYRRPAGFMISAASQWRPVNALAL